MKKLAVAVLVGGALVVMGTGVVDMLQVIHRTAQPAAVMAHGALQPFAVNPEWVKHGTPNFRAVTLVEAPDGDSTTGLWACDGPTTFDWHYGADETVHLLEGSIDIEYLGRRFTLKPGDTTIFYSGTHATWHVSDGAKKIFTLNKTSYAVRLWRTVFPPEA